MSLKQFTFSGAYNCKPFSVTVISESEENARERVLRAVAVEAKLQLLTVEYEVCNKEERLSQIPVTNSADPVEEHLGCFCPRMWELFTPVFNAPQSESFRRLTFTEWIKVVPAKIKPFDLSTVVVYSCLDG